MIRYGASTMETRNKEIVVGLRREGKGKEKEVERLSGETVVDEGNDSEGRVDERVVGKRVGVEREWEDNWI